MARAPAWVAAASLLVLAAGDADKGRELFRSLGCVVCHSVDGVGGGYAPDLAKRIGREQPPLGMAAGVWNRGVFMWALIEKKRLALPEPTEQDLADLYAYFYSARYFDKPGEAARGRQVFSWQQCAVCHPVAETPGAVAPAVPSWPPVADAIGLVERMWDAADQMREAMARKKLPWPTLTAQQASDLYAFASSLSTSRQRAGEIPPPAGLPGEKLFLMRNCAACHKGPRSLAGKFSAQTLTDLAVAIWNHAPLMGRRPALGYGEMRQIAGYLWTLQIVEPTGDPARGERVYQLRGCGACHGRPVSGAPTLTGRRLKPFTLMASLWRRGPHMHKKLAEAGRRWPQLSALELADLAAYLARGAVVH